MTGEDGFLNRWSRRKLSDVPEIDSDAVAAPPEVLPDQPAEDAPEKSDADILTELGLKDPDTLLPGDDFAGYMAKAVPLHLRNRALRKLWTSNPVLACVDGLNDYDDDFTKTVLPEGGLKTLYQVGRGIARRTVDALAEDVDATDEVASDHPAPDTETADEEDISLPNEQAEPPQPRQIAAATDDLDTPLRRRIRINFDDPT